MDQANEVQLGDIIEIAKGVYKGMYGIVFQVYGRNTAWVAVYMSGQIWKWCMPKDQLKVLTHRSYFYDVFKPVEYTVGASEDTTHTHYECTKCGYLEETFTSAKDMGEDYHFEEWQTRMETEALCHYCSLGIEKDAYEGEPKGVWLKRQIDSKGGLDWMMLARIRNYI